MFQNLNKVGAQILLVALVVNLAMSAAVAGEDYPVKVGQKVRVTIPGDSTAVKQGIVAGIDGGKLFIVSQAEMRIDRVTTNDGAAFDFPYIGATYNPKSGEVVGTTSDGAKIAISLDDISYADVVLFVKDRQIPFKFYSAEIHDRLEFGPVYPRMIWQGEISSLERAQAWRRAKSGTPMAIGAITGLAAGTFISISMYNSEKREESSKKELAFFDLEGLTIFFGTMCVIGGVTLGMLLGKAIAGKDGWREVPAEKLKVDVGMINKSHLGVSLAFKF